jgi:hypothetical protein
MLDNIQWFFSIKLCFVFLGNGGPFTNHKAMTFVYIVHLHPK